MQTDPDEIKKLNERIEKLEKTVNDLVSRYLFWMIGGAVLIVSVVLAIRR